MMISPQESFFSPQLEYIGRKVVSNGTALDFSWQRDYEAVILEYRQMRPTGGGAQWPRVRYSSDGGATFISGASDYKHGATSFGSTLLLGSINNVDRAGYLFSGASGAAQDNATAACNATLIIPRPFDAAQRTQHFVSASYRGQSAPLVSLGGASRNAADRTDAVRVDYVDSLDAIQNFNGEVRGYGLLRYPGAGRAISAPPASFAPGTPMLEPIAQKIASDQATVDFSWTTDYAYVMALIDNAAPVVGGRGFGLRTSADGVTFDSGASDYNSRGSGYVNVVASNGGVLPYAALTPTGATYGSIAASDANSGWAAVLLLHQPSVAGEVAFKCQGQYYRIGGDLMPTDAWGYRTTSAVVRGLRFQVTDGVTDGNISRGRFTLWGLLPA